MSSPNREKTQQLIKKDNGNALDVVYYYDKPSANQDQPSYHNDTACQYCYGEQQLRRYEAQQKGMYPCSHCVLHNEEHGHGKPNKLEKALREGKVPDKWLGSNAPDAWYDDPSNK